MQLGFRYYLYPPEMQLIKIKRVNYYIELFQLRIFYVGILITILWWVKITYWANVFGSSALFQNRCYYLPDLTRTLANML